MVRLGVIGMGKMGLSHLSIANSHPDVNVVGMCDTAGYILDIMQKYTGLPAFKDVRRLLDEGRPDAVVVATPSRSHYEITRQAIDRGIHAFVEKPLALSVAEGEALTERALQAGVVNQVGYHYRFVGAFQEARRLLHAGAIGAVHNYRVEAYGPVVLRPGGRTWRTRRHEGGGCLYDYASHAVNMSNYLFGPPSAVGGSVVEHVFSKDVEDEVYATLHHSDGRSGQLCVNWSDETHRKMSLRVEIWGTEGRINVDRQECQVYVRDWPKGALGLLSGWNIRYNTDLTDTVRFYVRGEEYSSQMDYFFDRIHAGNTANVNSFATAVETDRVLGMIRKDAELGPRAPVDTEVAVGRREGLRGWLARVGVRARRSGDAAEVLSD